MSQYDRTFRAIRAFGNGLFSDVQLARELEQESLDDYQHALLIVLAEMNLLEVHVDSISGRTFRLVGDKAEDAAQEL
jgi:hypothetical protein